MKALRYLSVGMQNIVRPSRAWAGPLHVQVEVTTFCNLDCVMCSHGTLIKHPRHMGLGNFIEICEKLMPYKVSMNGIGEPFLNPEMLPMVEYARDHRIETITTSNLTLLSPELAENIVHSGLGLLKGSIDSVDPQTYLAIRRRDMHDRVLEGLRNVRDAKKRLGSRLPYVRLQFVMQRANYKEIPDVLDLCREYGVDAIYFQPLDLINDNYVTDAMVGELIGDMDPVSFRQVLERAAQKSVHGKVATNLPALFRDFDAVWEKYRMIKAPDPETAVCMMPWTSLYVSVDGDVRLCCVFASSPEENLGNIFEQDFSAIWNGEAYRNYRKRFAKGERPNKLCRNCMAPTLGGMVKSFKHSKYMLK